MEDVLLSCLSTLNILDQGYCRNESCLLVSQIRHKALLYLSASGIRYRYSQHAMCYVECTKCYGHGHIMTHCVRNNASIQFLSVEDFHKNLNVDS